MGFVRNPNSSQLSGAMQPCQADCIAPIGLHTIARTLGNKGWSNDLALMPQPHDLAIKVDTSKNRRIMSNWAQEEAAAGG